MKHWSETGEWAQEILRDATPGDCFIQELCDQHWIEFINFTKDNMARVILLKKRNGEFTFASMTRCKREEIKTRIGFSPTGIENFLKHFDIAANLLKLSLK